MEQISERHNKYRHEVSEEDKQRIRQQRIWNLVTRALDHMPPEARQEWIDIRFHLQGALEEVTWAEIQQTITNMVEWEYIQTRGTRIRLTARGIGKGSRQRRIAR